MCQLLGILACAAEAIGAAPCGLRPSGYPASCRDEPAALRLTADSLPYLLFPKQHTAKLNPVAIVIFQANAS